MDTNSKRIAHIDGEISRLNEKLSSADNVEYDRDTSLVEEAIKRYRAELAILID